MGRQDTIQISLLEITLGDYLFLSKTLSETGKLVIYANLTI
ncbi:hypothetical protein NXZ84_01395 [Mechercharimyces sp. CAU 1602]|nr:hypothetical protein [Mechercharimyces sp. CAU 1602]